MAGGRSRRAAPLERLDVPPAGLSGRSRSCSNRSPWQPAQAPELPGWESSAGCRGCRCPSAGCAAPTTGGIALRPGHGTPWQDVAPRGILPSVLPQGRQRQRAGTGPGALDCAQAAGIREGLCRAAPRRAVPPGEGAQGACQAQQVGIGVASAVSLRGSLVSLRGSLVPPRAVVAAGEQGEEQGPAPAALPAPERTGQSPCGGWH